MAFVPASSTVYAVGSGGTVIKSTDDGESWALATAPGTRPLHGVSFATASAGYAVGNGSNVFLTANGDSSWTSVGVTGGSGEDFYDVVTWDDGSEAILVGQFGGVFEKTASTFAKVNLGSLAVAHHLWDVEVLDDGDIVRIGGDAGVALFRDEGTWTSPRSRTSGPIYKLSFLSDEHGFAVGQGFVITEYSAP